LSASPNLAAGPEVASNRSPFERFSDWALQPSVLIRTVIYTTTFLYLRTIFFDYVYDDSELIITNPWMASWKCVPAIFTHSFWGFLEFPRLIDFYRPLVMLTFAAVFHVFGPAPGWFHLMAGLLHVLATYLVYRLGCEATGDHILAAIAAGVFGLHPTKVETAAWISGISDSLSLVFFLASMISYFKWRTEEQHTRRSLFVSATFLLLALFSKEAAIFAPVLIAINELCLAKGKIRDRLVVTARAAWPFVAVTIFALIARMLLIRTPLGHQVNRIPIRATFFTAPQATLWYLRQQLWPADLSVQYPMMIVKHFSMSGFLLPLLLLVAVLIAVIAAVRKNATAIFFLSWFLVTLGPIILYHITLQEHDRYFYFSSVSSSMGIAYLLTKVRRFGVIANSIVVFALFVGMTISTFVYESYWDNETKLFTRAVRIARDNSDASSYLVSIYLGQKQYDKAEAVAQAVIDTPERTAEGWCMLGYILIEENKYDEALAAMQKSVQLTSGDNLGRNIGLASAETKLGHNAEAALIYRKELTRYPTLQFLHANLAYLLEQMGQHDEAQRERKLAARPGSSI
jgi:hypothetical protein